jgi:hypothetical protein
MEKDDYSTIRNAYLAWGRKTYKAVENGLKDREVTPSLSALLEIRFKHLKIIPKLNPLELALLRECQTLCEQIHRDHVDLRWLDYKPKKRKASS